MTRQYSRYSTSTPESGDDPSLGAGSSRSTESYGSGAYRSSASYGTTSVADRPATADDERNREDTDRLDAAYSGADDEDYYDDVYAYDEPIDRRWIWVAGVAGAILLIAVICTVVILGGGDSGPVSKTVPPPAPTTSHTASAAPSAAAAPSRQVAPPAAALAPETVTTVTPAPTTPVAAEAAPGLPAPDAATAPAPAASGATTVTYQVTGNRPLLDLVTVIYTDAQGALQTDVNVALPWTKTVTLNPGVSLSSVTATSVTGQLNCAITDGSGVAIAAQNNNTMITTCTR